MGFNSHIGVAFFLDGYVWNGGAFSGRKGVQVNCCLVKVLMFLDMCGFYSISIDKVQLSDTVTA